MDPRRHPHPLAPADPGLARGFRTPVRGHAFAARPPGGADPDGGLRLARERHNPVDPWAVAVWTVEGVPWRIGYLDRTVAARLAPALDAGAALGACLEGWIEAPGGWQRPLLAITDRGAVRRTATHRMSADVPVHGGGRLWGRPPGVTRRTLHHRG